MAEIENMRVWERDQLYVAGLATATRPAGDVYCIPHTHRSQRRRCLRSQTRRKGEG